jgi:hypothetical protein
MTGQGPTGYRSPQYPRPEHAQPPGPGWWMASDGLWYPPTATPYAGPPPGGPGATNGMGITAMVLGIVGAAIGLVWVLAFAALVCGVLAVVFGVVGRGRAAKLHLPGGPALAGLILGIVAVGLAGYGFYVQWRVVDAVTNIFSTTSVVANPSTNRMEITRCTTLAGSAVADGTLVNTSSETRSFRLYVGFQDASGFTTTADVVYTGRIAPHATASWSTFGDTSVSGLTGCAFVGDPNTGAPSTPISDVTRATPGS